MTKIAAKPTLLLLSSAQASDPLFQELHQILKNQLLTHRVILITSYTSHPSEPSNNEDTFYLYNKYSGIGPDQPAREARAVAQKIRMEFDLEPAILYKADGGFFTQLFTEAQMLDKAYFTLAQVREILSQHNVEAIYSAGGGSLFANAFFEYAGRHYPQIKTQRIFPLDYLNANTDTRRYLFSHNNHHRLDAFDPQQADQERYNKSLKRAENYYRSVKNKSFNPDVFARLSAQSAYFTPRFPEFLKLLVVYAVKSLTWKLFRRGQLRVRARERIYSFVRKIYLDLCRKTSIDLETPFFIFILHDRTDSQLLFRGRHFADQVGLCRLLANNLPAGTRLFIKEHPSFPGMLPIADVRRIKKVYGDKVEYLDYQSSFLAIVKKSAGVITINSTAGLEALIHGVPIVVLGEAFYRGEPFVYNLDYFMQLTEILKDMTLKKRIATETEVIHLIARAFYQSEPDPLTDCSYDLSEEAHCIAAGILRRTQSALMIRHDQKTFDRAF